MTHSQALANRHQLLGGGDSRRQTQGWGGEESRSGLRVMVVAMYCLPILSRRALSREGELKISTSMCLEGALVSHPLGIC